jgi:lipopolysaccharide/colanic/teichoic acid biosynthesis glycosyltransferase
LIDIIGAGALGILLLPLIVVLALLIAADGGPVLYRHRRVGRGGVLFNCYKLRTMKVDSEQVLTSLLARDDEARRQWQNERKLSRDPRVTRIGAFLRKSSLDELPQLWNVLTGDMSLVGPRPIVRDEARHYGRFIDDYYRTRPGLTGVWQVNGRNNVGYRGRVAMDMYYIRRWSIGLDLRILLKTVRTVIFCTGA